MLVHYGAGHHSIAIARDRPQSPSASFDLLPTPICGIFEAEPRSSAAVQLRHPKLECPCQPIRAASLFCSIPFTHTRTSVAHLGSDEGVSRPSPASVHLRSQCPSIWRGVSGGSIAIDLMASVQPLPRPNCLFAPASGSVSSGSGQYRGTIEVRSAENEHQPEHRDVLKYMLTRGGVRGAWPGFSRQALIVVPAIAGGARALPPAGWRRQRVQSRDETDQTRNPNSSRSRELGPRHS